MPVRAAISPRVAQPMSGQSMSGPISGRRAKRAMAVPSPMPGMEVRICWVRRVASRVLNRALRADVRESRRAVSVASRVARG